MNQNQNTGGAGYICNAIIENATITNDDHGLLTAWLTLNYGGSGQGFGGYALYLPKELEDSKNGIPCCGHFIWRVMEIAEVSTWATLKGKAIRVRQDKEWGKIEAIGHIVKDDWFNPSEDFEQMRGQYP